nr:nucleotide-binding alpha-beta plait domain-containing protein [Tanacetum cinerariifolium]
MVNTRTDVDLSAAVQNALQTLLPQIRAEIREEFRTSFGPSDASGNPPPVTIHTWLERFNKQKPHSFEKATAPRRSKKKSGFDALHKKNLRKRNLTPIIHKPPNFHGRVALKKDNVCKQYGQVVDAFIPDRKSKAGKRYGFVRFIRVYDVDHLVSNLCTLWMGGHYLHANVARFQRPPAVNSGGYTHQNEACEPTLLLDESCLNQLDYSLGLLGKVKEFSCFDNMRMVLGNEGFNDIDLRYMG